MDYVEIITDLTQLSTPGSKFCIGGKSSGRIAEVDKGQVLINFKSTTQENGGGGNYGFSLTVYSTCGQQKASDLTQGILSDFLKNPITFANLLQNVHLRQLVTTIKVLSLKQTVVTAIPGQDKLH